MACPSFSLPAGKTCPALDLCLQSETGGREAICRRCYAQKSRYKWKPVRDAQERRLAWWDATPPEGRAQTLASEARAGGEPRYFRCYDSGDFRDARDRDTWLRMAELLPNTVFWLPTRTWMVPELLPMLRELNARPTIVVRPSAACFGDPAPVVEGLAAGLAAPVSNKNPGRTADRVCPGQCGPCRLCWEATDLSVEFHRK